MTHIDPDNVELKRQFKKTGFVLISEDFRCSLYRKELLPVGENQLVEIQFKIYTQRNKQDLSGNYFVFINVDKVRIAMTFS